MLDIEEALEGAGEGEGRAKDCDEPLPWGVRVDGEGGRASLVPRACLALLAAALNAPLPARILARAAITRAEVPELTHSAFRPAGAGETCDKADDSLRPRQAER